MAQRCPQGESGQAAVESALVMPLMVFMCLGLLQLAMMQHAKLMTEYAAYQAARAGVVWNGHNGRMRDAAFMAVLPTMGRTDTIGRVATTWTQAQTMDQALRSVMSGSTGGAVPPDVNGSPLYGLLRIDTVGPSDVADIGGIWKLAAGGNWEELDFDGPTGFPEVDGLENFLGHFFNPGIADADEVTYRRATLLSIRLRYWYELRIPFANWIIFTSWFAANGGTTLHGAIDRPTLETGVSMTNQTSDVNALPGLVNGISHERGYNTLYPQEMAVLWNLSQGAVTLPGRNGRTFWMPLTATYSMRMQSNFYRKWIMHVNPGWGL